MPPILISIPDQEHSFVSFPEGTSDNDMRLFLGTQRAEQFPLIAEEVAEERENRTKLLGQLDRIRSMEVARQVRDPRLFRMFLEQTPEERLSQDISVPEGPGLLGAVRGVAAGLMLNQEVAEEELGEAGGRFLTGGLIGALGGPTLPELSTRAQIEFQERFGTAKIPFTDIHLFPQAPVFMDPQTGEFDNGSAFRPVRLGKAINAGLRQGTLEQVAAAGLDAILPPDEFGHEFEPFVPDGQLERTAMFMADIFARSPEFIAGGSFGKFLAGRIGAAPVGGVLRQQLLDRLGTWMGALGFAAFSDDVARNQIEHGMPGDLDEALERVSSAVVEGSKGLATGAAVAAAQAGTTALMARAMGIPASALPGSALQAKLLRGGELGAMGVTFGTVPNVLAGQPITVQGMADALSIVAFAGISESVLMGRLNRQVSRGEQPDLNRAVAELLAESERVAKKVTMMPPPPVAPQTRLTPQNASRGTIPDSQRLPGESGRVSEAVPTQEPAPRAVEPRPEVDLEAGLRQLEEGIAKPARPAIEPGRPEPPVEPLNLDVLRDRRASSEAEFRQEVDLSPETISAVEARMGDFRKYQTENDLARKRGLEERIGPQRPEPHKIGDEVKVMGRDSILADQATTSEGVRFEIFGDKKMRDKGGVLRQVDVDSGKVVTVKRFPDFELAEAEFNKALEASGTPLPRAERLRQREALTPIQQARVKARSPQEALESLVRDLDAIETKASPEAVQEATTRASDLSMEAVDLRQAEAQNLARQIIEADYFPAGESISQIIAASTETGTIRVRTRNNEGTQETIDIPISEGPIRGVSEFIEADRLVNISVQAAIAGRRAGAEQSGLIAKAKEVLLDQLDRLGKEEAGAFLFNPFSRKPKRPKTEPDEYLPPDVQQPSRDVLSRRKSEIAQNTDALESMLRRTGLTQKQRADLEMSLMRNREELLWLQEAADAAPFATVDPRAEFNERPIEDLRAQAAEQKIPLAESAPKAEIVEAMVNRRSEATGQVRAPISEAEGSARAERKLNEEFADASKRAVSLGARMRSGFGKAVNPTHKMKMDLERLERESPEHFKRVITRAFFEGELIRTAPATGLEIYRMRLKDIYGDLSRSEKAFLDKLARTRADLAQRIADPELKGRALEIDEAQDYLKHHRAQDPVAYDKISGRIDQLRDLYNEALEARVSVELTSRESADNMLSKGEYLPIRFAELADSEVTGIGPTRVPGPGALRQRKGGFEVELPDFETATVETLRGFAKANNIEIPEGLTKSQAFDAIAARVRRREARILDTEFLAEEYFRKTGRDIQRQRAMLALDEILTALPDNGIVIERAKVIRKKGGAQEFAPLEQSGIHEILPYRKDGELAGLVVNKQFADAIELRTQGGAGAQRAIQWLNTIFLAGFRKKFFTGPGAPLFWMVAFPRDFSQLGFSKPTFRDPTFQSLVPGVTSAKVGRAMQRVAGDAFTNGPITRRYLENGGAGMFLTRPKLFEQGEAMTEAVHSRIHSFESRDRDSSLARGIQNVSSLSRGGAENIGKTFSYLNESFEKVGRLAEFHEVERQIAAQKGIRVEDLPASDVREAAYAANSRMDLSAKTVVTSFIEPFELYTNAWLQSGRSAARMARDKPAQAGIRAMTLLGFGAIMYGLSKQMNPQATKDMPSHLKRDIVFPLPDSIGTFADEEGFNRFSAIRIPVDQNLATMMSFGWEVGAYLDREGQQDTDNMIGAATQVLKFRGQSSLGFIGSLFAEQFTNRSLIYEGKRLFEGREGGERGAEIDPENTSPAVERIGRMVPGVSPERLQESLSGQFGQALGIRLFANAANRVSGIPDLRTEEKKQFVGQFAFDRILKDFPQGGAGFRNQQDLQRITIAEENNFRTMFGRTLLRARARNDGVLVEDDDQLRAEIDAVVESPHKEIAKTMLKNQLRHQQLVEVTRFPRIWESILNADADVAGPRYYNFLLGLTAGNRALLEDEMGSMLKTGVKSTEWLNVLRGFINRFQPDFEELVESGILDSGILAESLESQLREPVQDPRLGRQVLEETPIEPQAVSQPFPQSVEEAFPLLTMPAPPR